MSVQVAKKLLQEMAQSANEKNYSAHMDLISQQVSVFGISGIDVIGYDDWARQCQQEFQNNVLKSVFYGPMKVVTHAPGRVMFKTLEVVEATDGTRNRNWLEIIIQKEDDGKWRVLQERILPQEETVDDGIVAANG